MNSNVFDKIIRSGVEKAFFVKTPNGYNRKRYVEWLAGREGDSFDRFPETFKTVVEDSTGDLEKVRNFRNTGLLALFTIPTAVITLLAASGGNINPDTLISFGRAAAPFAAAGVGVGALGSRFSFLDRYYSSRTFSGKLWKNLHKVVPIFPTWQDIKTIRRAVTNTVKAPFSAATVQLTKGITSAFNMLSGEKNYLGDKAVAIENRGADEIQNIPGVGDLLNRSTKWLKEKSFFYPTSESRQRALAAEKTS